MNQETSLIRTSGTKGWSHLQEQILIEEIENSPNNINHACLRASVKIGKNKGACTQKYYSDLKHRFNIIGLSSEKGAVVNIKNTKAPKDIDPLSNISFESIVEAITYCNPVQKRAIRAILNMGE